MLYFIQRGEGGPIKIGYTGNFDKRLSMIQGSNAEVLVVLATADGGSVEETACHRMLAEHRIRGEWFRPHPQVMEVARAAAAGTLPVEAEKEIRTLAPHAALVDALGGSRALADTFNLDQSTVSCWRTRGVSWKYRPRVAALAKRKRIALPEGFLA